MNGFCVLLLILAIKTLNPRILGVYIYLLRNGCNNMSRVIKTRHYYFSFVNNYEGCLHWLQFNTIAEQVDLERSNC